MTTLRVLLHVAAQRDYELHSLDFSTTFLQGSLHDEIWLRRPPGFTRSFLAGTQWSLCRPVYGLRQAPREWHDALRTTLAALGFAPSTADPSLFLRTDTSLVAAAVLHPRVLQRFGFQFSSPQPIPLSTGHSLSAPPSDESVETSGLYPELVGCLITSGMGLVLGGRARVVLTGHADASWVDDSATQRSSQGYTFSLGSGSVSWQSTRSSSVLSSSCEAEIYAGAMAAQELCWLTYLLTDLGEQPRSPPILYVDNKAMIALCQEHRLEHRTKHIALRYFIARELQHHGQLCLAYMATRANTADIFAKALPPGDHQRFSTVFGLLALLFLTGDVTTYPLRHKLQPKPRAAIYLEIAANERAWRVWDLGDKRVVTSRDVVFDEDKFPTKEQPTPQLTVVLPVREEDEANAIPPQVEMEAENGGGENEESDDDVVEVPSTTGAISSTPSSLPLALTREQRTRRPNTKYIDYATVAVGELDEERAAYCFATLGDDPRTHTEALASPDAPLWKQAMEKELASIKENDVFELVDPLKGAYFVGCKWVLKKKLGAYGSAYGF
ncbi:unnamed protein product [Closterium sp. NIES-53]